MLEKIKQIEDLETIFNMLDNIDDFNLSEDEYERYVVDYIAGMTDKYALNKFLAFSEHQ